MYCLSVNAALLYTYAPRSYLPAGAAAGHVWVPDAETRAAGERANVPYVGAGETGPGEQRSPFPAVVALHDAIVPVWPGIPSGGMRRDSARIGTTSHDPHKFGTAIDFSVRNDANRARNGDALANFFARNAELLQTQLIIWSNTELSTSRSGQKWETYSGQSSHEDHVHVEIGGVARGWTHAEMMRRVRAALAAYGVVDHTGRNVLIAGTLVAGAAALWAFGRR